MSLSGSDVSPCGGCERPSTSLVCLFLFSTAHHYLLGCNVGFPLTMSRDGSILCVCVMAVQMSSSESLSCTSVNWFQKKMVQQFRSDDPVCQLVFLFGKLDVVLHSSGMAEFLQPVKYLSRLCLASGILKDSLLSLSFLLCSFGELGLANEISCTFSWSVSRLECWSPF